LLDLEGTGRRTGRRAGWRTGRRAGGCTGRRAGGYTGRRSHGGRRSGGGDAGPRPLPGDVQQPPRTHKRPDLRTLTLLGVPGTGSIPTVQFRGISGGGRFVETGGSVSIRQVGSRSSLRNVTTSVSQVMVNPPISSRVVCGRCINSSIDYLQAKPGNDSVGMDPIHPHTDRSQPAFCFRHKQTSYS